MTDSDSFLAEVSESRCFPSTIIFDSLKYEGQFRRITVGDVDRTNIQDAFQWACANSRDTP